MQTSRQRLDTAVFLCFCFLAPLFTPALVNAATLPKTAKLVPNETIVLVEIDDFTELRAQFEKTNLYKFIKDPAMSAFVEDLKSKWREKKQDEKNEDIPGILRDVDVWPRGRIALAVVLNEQMEDMDDPPVLFITQWGDGIDKVKDAVDKNVEKAIEDGARREIEEYRGVRIVTMTDKTSDTFSFCFWEDCLIGGVSLDHLKFVVAQIEGAGSSTLADDDDYNASFRALGSDGPGQAGFYVNIKQIITMGLAEDEEGEIKTMIDNLGLSNVTSFAGTIDPAGGPGGGSLAKALLKINGEKKGICKMLEVESVGLRIPRFVPASSSAVSVIHLDIKKAFAELSDIIGNFSPQAAAMLYMPLVPSNSPSEPPLVLKTGLIDHLGSRIVIAQSVKKSSSDPGAASTEGQALIAIAIDNRDALEKSLSLLHSTFIAPNNPDARRELLGHTIYSIDLSKFLPFLAAGARGPDAPKMPPWGFTVTDTHLIFAPEAAVERTVRTLGGGIESIDSAKWFAKAKANIPSAMGLAGMEDIAATMEPIWVTMRESKKENKEERSRNELGVGMSTDSIFPHVTFSPGGSEFFDLSLLPEFDAVRKYFGVSAFYGISRPDGFFFEAKYLNPDGIR
ncbi:MAG: hypothetical protein JXM79_19405 [Sedimentisphaerales bacterium]|nr:hypothetical protein [Sedimentisphaerales bacterium]